MNPRPLTSTPPAGSLVRFIILRSLGMAVFFLGGFAPLWAGDAAESRSEEGARLEQRLAELKHEEERLAVALYKPGATAKQKAENRAKLDVNRHDQDVVRRQLKELAPDRWAEDAVESPSEGGARLEQRLAELKHKEERLAVALHKPGATADQKAENRAKLDVNRHDQDVVRRQLKELASDHTKLWVGVSFAIATFFLLAIIFFTRPVLTDDQRSILRIFCALLAGCAGVFLAGEALFNLSRESGPTKMAVQGTAGFALFFTVWFTFNPLRKRSGATGFSISFVEDMSFKRVTEILGNEIGAGINLDALKPEEKAAKIRGVNVQAKSARDVLAKLNEFVKPPDKVRAFSLEPDGVILKISPR